MFIYLNAQIKSNFTSDANLTVSKDTWNIFARISHKALVESGDQSRAIFLSQPISSDPQLDAVITRGTHWRQWERCVQQHLKASLNHLFVSEIHRFFYLLFFLLKQQQGGTMFSHMWVFYFIQQSLSSSSLEDKSLPVTIKLSVTASVCSSARRSAERPDKTSSFH